MNDLRIRERVLWPLGLCACLAPAVRAGEPAAIVPGTAAPAGSSAAAKVESPLERVWRLRHSSMDVTSFDAPESADAAGAAPDLLEPVSTEPVPTRSSPLADPYVPVILRTMPSPDPSTVRTTEEPARDPDTGAPIHPALTDRFFFGLGTFSATSSTTARLNSPSGVGTTVGFEDLLGLETSRFAPQGLARWRMSERWRLELEYFQLDRSNTKTIGQDINWGDQVFPTGTTLDSKFNISVLRLSAGYSFFKRPDKELGVALGFHLTDINASLSGGGSNSDSGQLLAPLPVVSLYGQVALTDLWALSGRLDAFRIEYDPYRGHIYSLGIDATCQPWRHVGFGFGWRSLEVEGSASSNDWEGAIRSTFQGPIAFISCSF